MTPLGAGPRLALAEAPALLEGGRAWPLALPDALLLAWLAVEGPTPRERLAALLWPASDGDAARNALRQRLFRLRRQVGRELVQGGAVLALADGLQHDLGAGAAGLLSGLHAPESPELDAWLAQRRALLAAGRRQALLARIETLEADGDAPAALPLAAELLALDPLSEEAHRRLMRLHYLAGDRAAALRAFDECERMLKHEIGATPSAATRELLALIETGAEQAPPPSAPGWRGPLPASVLRPPRLVGRERELAALAEAWRDTARVVVSGEAGIGKSRLLASLNAPAGATAVATSAAAAPVAFASARPGDHLVPYASAARLLRAVLALAPAALQALPLVSQQRLAPLLPGLAPEPGAPGERQPPAEAARELLQAAMPPLAGIVLDDLHFADEATLELLPALLALPRLRWCLGSRPAAPGSALAQLLDHLAGAGPLVQVAMRPLGVAALAELVDSLALPGVAGSRLAPALARRSGGNPLFALETLKLAWHHGRFDLDAGLPQPPSLAQLIGEQLARLSAAALALARLAAIAGVDFSLELAEQVLAKDALALADPWHELEAERVLVGAEFAHDLVYETVLAGVPALIARALHARVAARLEAGGGEPARVAAHWEAAGDRARALPGLRAAAERAHAALREHERIQILLRAAEIAEGMQQPEVAFDCIARAVESHMNAIREEGGFPLLDRLDKLATNDAERARALGMRAWYLSQLPDHDAAVSLGEQALAVAESLPDAQADRALTGGIRQRLGTSLAMLGRFDEALAHLSAVEPWAEAALPADELAEFHGNMAVVLDNLGRPGQAEPHHVSAGQHSQRVADHAQRITHLANHGVNRLNAGDVTGAMRLVEQAQQLAASYEMQGASVAFVWLLRSQAARALGHYRDALAAADHALALLESANPARRPLVWLHRAQVWLELGQFARAGQDLQAAGDGDGLPPHAAARRLLMLARWQQALGQPGAPLLAEALAAAPPNGWPEVRLTIQLEHALTLQDGDVSRALQAVHETARALGLPGSVQAAEMHLAAHGRGAPAGRFADSAWARADLVLPTLRPRAELWSCVAAGLRNAGEAARAAAVAADGQRWLAAAAEQHVDAAFRASFLHRVPLHARLLAGA